jgi:hypothetical protein
MCTSVLRNLDIHNINQDLQEEGCNGTEYVHLVFSFMLVSCLVYSLTLKMEAKFSSTAQVDYFSELCGVIPEDDFS